MLLKYVPTAAITETAEQSNHTPVRGLAAATPGTCRLTLLTAGGWRSTGPHQIEVQQSQSLPPLGAPCTCLQLQ